MAHANARLGPAGRRQLVHLMCVLGYPERRAAESLGVSRTTAHRWKRRWLSAGEELRRSGAWTVDRSSRPHRSPGRTAAAVEQRVLAARARTGWGPRLIAGQTGVAHSTVHAILKRHGCSRPPRKPRERFIRYEWPCPGDLLHMDIKRYRRFRRPGYPFIADERQTSQELATHLGFDYFHAILDDHSRLAYGELLADQRAPTVTAFTERALAWFAEHGIHTRRLLTDGAWSYPTTAHCANCSTPTGSATSSPRPTHPAGTGRSSASTRRWTANGPAASSTQQQRQKPRPETLARPLQPTPTPQRTRRPTTNQPRSQPLRARHLPSRS